MKVLEKRNQLTPEQYPTRFPTKNGTTACGMNLAEKVLMRLEHEMIDLEELQKALPLKKSIQRR